MTQVEIHFELGAPLDDKLTEAIARAHAIYGIRKIHFADDGTSLTVEYDASRLQPPQVEAALHRAGIKAVRKDSQLT